MNSMLAPRGFVGITPRPSSLSDESYMDYVQSFRKMVIQDMFPVVAEAGEAAYAEHKAERGAEDDSIDDIMQTFGGLPVARSWQRFVRTQQEMMWRRSRESLLRVADAYLAEVDAAESEGPSHVETTDGFVTPGWARQEIHLQPGGYTREALAGLYYDYGLKLFMGGAADEDRVAKGAAMAAAVPDDGRVERILDLGCSAGATSIALKERHPPAEVFGIDIVAPMVRYAHRRAIEADADVHFRQMPAEDLAFPDNHFDSVLAMLLFHEIPVPVAREVIAEAYRVLRPGGKFTVIDFSGDRQRGVYTMFFAEMDAADNGELYLTEYVRSNVEDLLVEAGFELEHYDPKQALTRGRVAVKPAN